MSGGSGYRSSEMYGDARKMRTLRGATRKAFEAERTERIDDARESLHTGRRVDTGIDFDAGVWIDHGLALHTVDYTRLDRLQDTTVVLVDMTGSNKEVRRRVLEGAHYIGANLGLVTPTQGRYGLTLAFFGDHSDGRRWWRAFGPIGTAEDEEPVLAASMNDVSVVDGGDYPECMSRALEKVLGIDFAGVPKKARHLVIVGDSVPHGVLTREDMRNLGPRWADLGCSRCPPWDEVVGDVDKVFSTFTFVGCGGDPNVIPVQRRLLGQGARQAYDFIDLSYMANQQLRLGIVLNVILFAIARGSSVTERSLDPIQVFLGALYEKWIVNPLPEFGDRADYHARRTLMRFAPYLPAKRGRIVDLMSYVLSLSKSEVESLERELGLTL